MSRNKWSFKKWVIQKRSSMNPEGKRLAILTEIILNAYKDFEGTIPWGNYDAETVIVWDNGTVF